MPVDQATCGIGLLLRKPVPRCEGVGINGFFGRQIAIALPEAAIVNREHGESELMQLLDAAKLARQVPPRAMQVQNRRRVGALGRPPPCIELRRIRGGADRQNHLAHAVRKAGKPSGFDARRTKCQLAFALFELHAAADQRGQHAAQYEDPCDGRVRPVASTHGFNPGGGGQG